MEPTNPWDDKVPPGVARGLHGSLPAELRRHGGRRRLFGPGDVKLLALRCLHEAPRHGYEIIRAIGDAVGGDYSPSPGTIYPALAYLEDMGFASAAAAGEGGRKQYCITPGGEVHLVEQAEAVQRLLARLHRGREQARARGIPEIQRAMENLKTALRLRFEHDAPDAETVGRLVGVIDRAAVEIGQV
ncbi:PadR family transcriptional regulator [Verticiella sediminum]|uniref:PadR family transcriptional regulator n=1 Tax=Verticiella sediminum TaxID=1247510 RepID=A0A556AZD4_9BURK|nr:PadR family transcriptional regulator [Verticiella sediminum]TSH98300.1 PadR family transcriptional regulator [Verticiella sediminum]